MTNWYETNWFASIAGSVMTIVVTVIIFGLTNLYQNKQEQKNFLLYLINGYRPLFSYISLCNFSNFKNIDFLKLRVLLEENVMLLLILPSDLKKDFISLYNIYFTNPIYYQDNNFKITEILSKIIYKLNKYGVDVFGYKY